MRVLSRLAFVLPAVLLASFVLLLLVAALVAVAEWLDRERIHV